MNVVNKMDALELVNVFAVKLTMLTKKQRVVFDLLSNGMQSKEIAIHLGVAEITVKVRKAKLMQVLEITTLQELSRIYQCTNCKYIKSFM
ncbi:MAG: LuxR C-terminal-related transcriptional regulator [Methylophilales bacterium]|jgi:FixJ family two-component response regulator|nr:LuxR C-terminal-related transcriptional regulator [Methylophilales bacterium]